MDPVEPDPDLLVLACRLSEAHPFLGVEPHHVASWLGRCPERVFRPGQQLCREKSYGDEAYVVTAGRVIVSRLDRRGFPAPIVTLDPPILVGQLSLIDDAIRSATLTAEGVVTVRVLDGATWQHVARSPTAEGAALRRLVMSSLQQQLFRTLGQISEIAGGTGPAVPAQQNERLIPVVRLDDDDFEPDQFTDDLTDEQKIAAINPHKR